MSVYLMLFSAPVLIIGLICAVLTPIFNKIVEVSEDQVGQLILNIDENDYQKGDLDNIKADNNFIVVNNFKHEINYVEALMLLEIAKGEEIEVKLIQQAGFIGLDQNPKELFNTCMDSLWSVSG